MFTQRDAHGNMTETYLQAGDSVVWDVEGETIKFHRGNEGNSGLESPCWGDKHLVHFRNEKDFLDLCSVIAAVVPGHLRPGKMEKLHWGGWQCDFVEIPKTS